MMRLDLGQFDKRKVARIAAVLVVALAAGHLVQTMAARKQPAQPRFAEAGDLPKPVAVVQLAGTVDIPAQSAPPKAPLPAAAFATTLPVPSMAVPPAAQPEPAPVAVADPCKITLDLMADPGAMIGLTMLAPCNLNQRVVLSHAGLAVSAMTTATGSVFMAIPALESDARVTVRFADGSEVASGVSVPDLAGLRRFGVQWQGDDAFQVFGYTGADAVSATNPGLPPIGDLPMSNGFLTRLGDATADTPLLAEIYTYPATGNPDVVVEAAVTPATCGREILGETLASAGGAVTVTDLTLAMPDCDAVGDFLVLNNLAPDLTLAAAN